MLSVGAEMEIVEVCPPFVVFGMKSHQGTSVHTLITTPYSQLFSEEIVSLKTLMAERP